MANYLQLTYEGEVMIKDNVDEEMKYHGTLDEFLIENQGAFEPIPEGMKECRYLPGEFLKYSDGKGHPINTEGNDVQWAWGNMVLGKVSALTAAWRIRVPEEE